MKNNDEQNQSEFIIGRHPVVSALRGKQEINKVFLQNGIHKDEKSVEEIIKLAKKKHLVISMVPKQKLDLLSDHQNHQGVVLSISPYKYASIDELFEHSKSKDTEPFFLILDNIEDPHNLGSIIRTADAAGVTGIIIPKHRAVGLTATVAKTSAGAIERVPVARVTNLINTVNELKDRGVWIFGTDIKGTDYRHWDAKGSSAVVIGNEGKGISPLLKKNVDEMLTIPMIGNLQSLNASVAAGLLMYQGYSSRHPL
ncbi:23S rRNA (guanosine(2251)-2'-O)-methyltransferase RlmB [Apilactobacillus micheneri]|uniref:23S rRNA (Guanosine(2251)-2'-O)-methyltransferase RlmB n=1 Tax=Apilactobacillus micheneri TaxID=1899430 RepID=A0ABY2YVD5_9LACO|nr:23S rRNA (guanosine(2251)-2'-O)-methyltransferase RlmB [Apilactobacillus micheneri]TPR24202.1 23S rRNA (guanosine(2251)-2'-O)-methyltransferase RlmB [Apilactobacillus micheneri]TPR25221.1 23S rRNA (guanosine(2251)-2'-O)-methyltransferase RlmB [Apilactobacillus micheneri]TPR27533.1 23S rRNA (guanosine(2251)-2'-O)-methyltransferase RlmB [Apilactobacillus micheneri]TPR28798.1 23S rRNA (guanosine(2251)-2'-O)-methyltransferase RlmB [Apilactobacillus micheneri]TPR29820.1 23S rRNA (guanosine(2251)